VARGPLGKGPARGKKRPFAKGPHPSAKPQAGAAGPTSGDAATAGGEAGQQPAFRPEGGKPPGRAGRRRRNRNRNRNRGSSGGPPTPSGGDAGGLPA
jgi:hypothetical protein